MQVAQAPLRELVRRLTRQGFQIAETPIVFRDRERGKSKMSGRIIVESMLKHSRDPSSVSVAMRNTLSQLGKISRDLQNAAKAKGHPWEAGKAFDASAPISAIRPMSGLPPEGAIFLSVNGVEKQRGEIADMIWNVAEVIAKASQLWRLEAGDLIFTGTPEGVGAIVRGDRVEGEVEGGGKLSFTLA